MINFGGGEYRQGDAEYTIRLSPPDLYNPTTYRIYYTMYFPSGTITGPHLVRDGILDTLSDALDFLQIWLWPSEEELIVWPPQLTEKGVSE